MYIAQYKIANEKKLDNGYIEVSFEKLNDKEVTNEIYSKDVLKLVKTKEPSDLTTLRDTRCNPIAEDILQLFLTKNVKISEIQYIFQLIIGSVEHGKSATIEKLLGQSEDNFSMLKIDEVLKG